MYLEQTCVKILNMKFLRQCLKVFQDCAYSKHLQYYGTVHVYKSVLVNRSLSCMTCKFLLHPIVSQIIKNCNTTGITETLLSTFFSTAVLCLSSHIEMRTAARPKITHCSIAED